MVTTINRYPFLDEEECMECEVNEILQEPKWGSSVWEDWLGLDEYSMDDTFDSYGDLYE